jgi:hypothetical protein
MAAKRVHLTRLLAHGSVKSNALEGARAHGNTWEVLLASAGAWKRVDHHGGAWVRVKCVGK